MKYHCHHCEYHTYNATDYEKHLNTRKHISNIVSDSEDIIYKCDQCNFKCNSRTTLWRHRKTCMSDIMDENITISISDTLELREELNELHVKMDAIAQTNSELTKVMSTFIEQLKQPEAQIAGNHNVMNNHSNNHTSILMMLNTEYKDVIPLDTFAKNIHVSLERTMSALNRDMPSLTRDIFLDNLAGMLPGERPIHCSDAKRETYYVKGKELWEKGGPNKLNGMIGQTHCGHMKNLKTWEIAHPNWISDDVMSQEYVKTLGNLMSIVNDDDDKIKHKTIQLINEHIPIKDITHAVGNME